MERSTGRVQRLDQGRQPRSQARRALLGRRVQLRSTKPARVWPNTCGTAAATSRAHFKTGTVDCATGPCPEPTLVSGPRSPWHHPNGVASWREPALELVLGTPEARQAQWWWGRSRLGGHQLGGGFGPSSDATRWASTSRVGMLNSRRGADLTFEQCKGGSRMPNDGLWTMRNVRSLRRGCL